MAKKYVQIVNGKYIGLKAWLNDSKGPHPEQSYQLKKIMVPSKEKIERTLRRTSVVLLSQKQSSPSVTLIEGIFKEYHGEHKKLRNLASFLVSFKLGPQDIVDLGEFVTDIVTKANQEF
jgi:hypothetical protein